VPPNHSTRPTLLRVPLSSVMEWEGKKTLVEIIKDDPRFDTKKLASDRANEFAVNIYFAWKPDTLQLADVPGDEDEGQSVMVNNNKRARKSDAKGRTARASLESPQKRKQAVEVRTRRQAQLEDGGRGGGEARGCR
jgi:hypothetical protein